MCLYLMDTDFDMNSEFDRQITHQLYGGDWENRIKQEYMLGIGGVLMLKKLGIKSRALPLQRRPCSPAQPPASG